MFFVASKRFAYFFRNIDVYVFLAIFSAAWSSEFLLHCKKSDGKW